MAPMVIFDGDSSKSPKQASVVTYSIAERLGFPSTSPNSDAEAVNADAEISRFPPKKLVSQLVFTQFGLFPASLSPARPYMQPLQPQCLPISIWKVETPRSEPETIDNKHQGIPENTRRCRCIQSRCIKLYCECFAAGAYCDGCSCKGCRNNTENEALRKAAVASVLERNPNAFTPKIATAPCGPRDNGDDAKLEKHNRGCHCKKTGCLKKYCECFQARVFCSDNCKCVDCKNYASCMKTTAFSGGDTSNTDTCKTLEGSDRRLAIPIGNHCNTMICKYFKGWEKKMAVTIHKDSDRKLRIQQANSAMFAALKFRRQRCSRESRKRKFQQFLFSDNKLNPLSAAPLPVVSSGHAGSSAKHGNSKSVGRSSLADLIHSQDAEELCSILVSISEATKVIKGTNCIQCIQAVSEDQDAKVTFVQHMRNYHERHDVLQEVSDDHLSGNEADETNIRRSSSPEMTASTRIEKLQLFVGATERGQNLSNRCDRDVYQEQEKLVLESFKDYLKKLITIENVKGPCQPLDGNMV